MKGSNWIWNYSKQALKGFGVVGLGVLGYMGLRGYWRSDEATSQTKSTDLVAATDTSTSVIKKDLTNTPVPTSQNIWNSAEQSLQYRRKRGVVPVAEEFQVNTDTIAGSSSPPAIASLPNGEFVITWPGGSKRSSRIYAQRFAGNGARLSSNFQVNTNTTSQPQFPAITSLSNGEFVITWQSDSYNRIYAQRFNVDGAGLGNEFQVSTNTAGYPLYPAIASLPNGEFVITWQGNAYKEIYVQRFASNGTRLDSNFQVNTNTTYDQNPAIASLPNGEFVITWEDGKNNGVSAQRFDVNGAPIGSEFQVDAAADPAIASLPNGEFVITWEDGKNNGISAQRFAGNGTRLNSEFQVNTNTTFSLAPDIATLSNGEFIIAWESSENIYAQRFDINGARLGSEFQVNTNTTFNHKPAITILFNDRFVITWWQSGSNNEIYARLFTTIYTPPQLNRNLLTIGQGQTLVLAPSQLLVFSESVSISNLTLIASNVTYGWFTYVNNSTLPIFNFTQADVNNGQVQFTQDNSYNAPGYQIAVFDGTNMLAPQSAVVDFDQKPIWINNQISIANRRQIQLPFTALLATDDKTNSQVFFEVRNVSHGAFALSSVADPFTNPISNFTQLQVNASQINFAHDGSNIAPSCEIRASDGGLYTAFQPCRFLFTYNQPPQLTHNELTLVKGEVKVVDARSLVAIKSDATAEEFNQLMFNFTVVQHGQFVLTTNPNQTVSSAQQNYITAGHLLFKHDGSDQAPSYNVTVSDGYNVTESQAAKINFSLFQPQDNNAAIIGGAVGGTGAALLLAGVGIFGAYRHRRNKQLEEQRANNPLANAFYHELEISGTEDFQSEKGIAFTNAVDCLNNELIRVGVNIEQMVPEAINELANKLATATKAQLGERMNLLDIQDCAQGIVATAMTLSGRNKINEAVTEMDDVMLQSAKKKVLHEAMDRFLQKKNINLAHLSQNEVEALVKPLLSSEESPHFSV